MEIAIEQQIAELGRMTVTQLRQKYAEVFGEETRSNTVATATMTAFSANFSMIRYWVISFAASTASMAGAIVKMIKRAISAS